MKSKRIWMSVSVWPERRSSAAGVRVWQWLDRFLARGWTVALHSAAHRQGCAREVIAEIDARGIERFEGDVNAAVWTERLARWRPDWVWMDRFVVEEQWSWRAAIAAPRALRVLDTQDIHFLRAARSVGFLGEKASAQIAGELRERTLRELGAIGRADVALVLSTEEMRMLTGKYGISERKLEWSPYAYGARPEGGRAFSGRKHFAFIGNYRHAPNLDAVMWFAREIWPALRGAMPEAEWHLYGAYLPSEVKQLERIPGICVRGQAKDARETLARYRALLAPIRFGAGIKGKITDAWCAGTPVLTTAVGIEGLWPRAEIGRGHPFWILPTDDGVGAWIRAAKSVWNDEGVWSELQQKGETVLREWHTVERADALLDRLCEREAAVWNLRDQDAFGHAMWMPKRQWTKGFSRHIALQKLLRERVNIGDRLVDSKPHAQDGACVPSSKIDDAVSSI